ncbi:hypothetical protein [Clostridium tetani]|nr:hypothetical protein [Clostridium tetani]
MDNKEVIDQAVKLYFQGGNWHKYLKEQVKKRESINIKNIEGDK